MRESQTLMGALNDHRTSQAAFIAKTLAWAAAHRMPMDRVAHRLVPNPAITGLAMFIGNPLFVFVAAIVAGPRAVYGIVLKTVERSLAKGRNPAEVVRDQLGTLLPGYLREAIAISLERPEQRHRLPRLLGDMSHEPVWISMLLTRFTFPLLYMSVAGYFITRFTFFIIPKFARMADEMGNGTTPYLDLIQSTPVLTLIWVINIAVVMLSVLVLALWLRLFKIFRWLGEIPCLLIPGLRQIYLTALAREGALSMRTALGMDMHIEDAVAWSMDHTDSLWLRRRLRKVGDAMDAGHDWADAWVRGGLARGRGGELAAARINEDPVRGYRAMADALNARLALQTRRLERVCEVLRLVVTGILVVILCLALHMTLNSMINVLVEAY